MYEGPLNAEVQVMASGSQFNGAAPADVESPNDRPGGYRQFAEGAVGGQMILSPSTAVKFSNYTESPKFRTIKSIRLKATAITSWSVKVVDLDDVLPDVEIFASSDTDASLNEEIVLHPNQAIEIVSVGATVLATAEIHYVLGVR